MNQKTIFNDSFEMRYIINKIVDISLSNKKKNRVENETNLQYFDKYE